MLRRNFLMLPAVLLPLAHADSASSLWEMQNVRDFAARLHTEHGFEPDFLREFFSALQVSTRVIELMDAPRGSGTKTYWREYRRRMLAPRKVASGRSFLKQHTDVLSQVHKRYGVPPAIVTAILGVESNYGKVLGGFNIARAIATLAFAYPRRAREFSAQMSELLIYARQAKIDPLSLRGSFAGAFGMSQFLPGTARRFAVDFDGDGKANLFSPSDAAASIGNFLKNHGWTPDGALLHPVQSVTNPDALIDATRQNSYRPSFLPRQLAAAGVSAEGLAENEPYLFVDLENRYDFEYRLGGVNFYALTRYNKSFKYAAAVSDLADAIAGGR